MMDHETAVDLLGTRPQISTEGRRVVSLKEVFIALSRRRRFWLFLVAALIVGAAAFVSLIYLLPSLLSLQRSDVISIQLPIPTSAVKNQIYTVHSPWHDLGVGASTVCNTNDCVHAALQLLVGMNHAANPCDDFYEFACGNWVKMYRAWGLTFYNHAHGLTTSQNELLKGILNRPPDSLEFQPVKVAATYFHQCVHQDNVSSVVELTTKLGGWPTLEGENWNEDDFDLETTLAFLLRRYNLSIFFGINLAPYSESNETLYRIELNVPALIPEDKLRNETIIAAFKTLFKKILGELTGSEDWNDEQMQDADDLLQFAKTLAAAVSTSGDNANDTRTEGSFTVAELQEDLDESLYWLDKPVSNYSISWERLLNETLSTSGVQLNEGELLVVTNIGYFERMTQILDATPKRTIANYIFWSLALELLPEASRKMEQAVEEFSTLIGKPVDLQSRQNYCLVYTMVSFGVPIMHEYLKKKPNLEASLCTVDQMTTNLKTTFEELLESNTWLSDGAKLMAQNKLKAMKTFIGYPNWLLNATEIEDGFEGLHLGSNYIETLGNVMEWTNDEIFQQLGQSPSDFYEPWFVPQPLGSFSVFNEYSLILPSGVGGYYISRPNSLVLSMGLIQPHYFYKDVPSYVNYGRIGAVIGHEIIHGFDATRKNVAEDGQFYDQSWTDEDKTNHEDKSNCFRDQYNEFEIFPGVHLNGSGGLDENIADNDGLKLAYLTFKREYTLAGSDHQSLPLFEKLSAEQLFFLSYGSLWCEHGNEAIQKLRLREDPHSPGKYRINGALQNSAEFADAWNCPAGVPMNPIKKCTLW